MLLNIREQILDNKRICYHDIYNQVGNEIILSLAGKDVPFASIVLSGVYNIIGHEIYND